MTWRSFLILVLLSGSLQAQSTLRQAQMAYQRRDYVGAKALLTKGLSEISNPTERSTYEYNLGNCAFESGKYPQAIWRYRRALIAAPSDPHIEFNLRFAESRMGLFNQNAPGNEGIGSVLDPIADMLNVFGLIVVQLAAILGGIWYRRRGSLCAVFLLLLVLSLIVGLRVWSKTDSPPLVMAVVLEPRVALKQEPHLSLSGSVVLQAGTLIEIVEKSETWAHARTNTHHGWVLCSQIGLIE